LNPSRYRESIGQRKTQINGGYDTAIIQIIVVSVTKLVMGTTSIAEHRIFSACLTKLTFLVHFGVVSVFSSHLERSLEFKVECGKAELTF